MFNLHIFFKGVGCGEGACTSTDNCNNVTLQGNAFKNVYHWAHALYKKIFNTFKSFTDRTSLLSCFVSQLPIPVSVCQEYFRRPTTTAVDLVAPTQNFVVHPTDQANFDLNFSISDCNHSVDSCNDVSIRFEFFYL